jgi:tRNA pseudouridine55 synthase
VDALAALADSGAAIPLIPLDEAAKAALPVLALSEDEATNLSYGKPLRERKDELTKPEHDDDFTHDAAAVAPDGRVIAVVRRVKGAAKPVIVFAPAKPA